MATPKTRSDRVRGAPRAPSANDAPGRVRVRFVDDAALVAGMRKGNPSAMAEFHDRFAQRVQRLLWGILGPDRELADLHHDVFVRALQSIGQLKDPAALSAWMTGITVHTARACIEKRTNRRRWWSARSSDELPERQAADPRGLVNAREALRAVHRVLEQLPTAERLAFALRHLDGLELTAVAEACDVSLATIKRRLARAEARFATLARRSPSLATYLEQGGARWIQR